MKGLILSILLLSISSSCFSQAYIHMPSDSAVWRYRFYDIDFITQVMDMILYVNNEDTLHGGKSYHKVFSRSRYTAQDNSLPLPPVTDVVASYPDQYYGAYREEDKKIYYLTSSGAERLIYDYTAGVGDDIPSYAGTATIVSIDSIALADGYHRSFNTSISYFAPIEVLAAVQACCRSW